jgi:hypothetical protein
MPTRAATPKSASHASKPFFDSRSARAPAFFSPSPHSIAAKEQGERDYENESRTDEAGVQAKLTMGSPGDPFEREADAMADRVVQRMATGVVSGADGPPVQAKCAACAGERAETQDGVLQAKGGDAGVGVPDSVAQSLAGSSGGGEALNPALREDMESAFGADFSTVRIHAGSSAAQLSEDIHARAFTSGTDIYFNSGEFSPQTPQGQHLLAHELTHVLQQGGGQSVARRIQRQPKKKKPEYVAFNIQVTEQVDAEGFKKLVMQQVWGGPLTRGVEWKNVRDSYGPKDSPVVHHVEVTLLTHKRGDARNTRGISTDAAGEVEGAKERAKKFDGGALDAEKTALKNEIERRLSLAIGDPAAIKKGDKGQAALRQAIRDEVLFQHEYIGNLPPQVKELIKFSTEGKILTPADYDKLFAIAKKIEKMPPGQVSDYASKVRGTTTDLDVFEKSLDKYIAEMAFREEQRQERTDTQNKLIGLEEVYRKYRAYLSMLKTGTSASFSGRYGGAGIGTGLGVASQAATMRAELETALKAHGFTGIPQFELYIKNFENAFERESAHIARDLLEKYAGKLYRESERYKDPAEVAAQHQKLAGFRESLGVAATNAQIWNEYVETKDLHRIQGQGHVKPKHSRADAEVALQKAKDADAAGQAQLKDVTETHPVFREEGLPQDKRIDKIKLGLASESDLALLLQQYIQARLKDIDTASAEISDKPALIYKMDKLMPQFYVQQGIKPGSIFDLIIQDKKRDDLVLKIVTGLALAVIAIALAVVTFGAATPVILAAGAGIGGVALGTYMAVEEYKEYVEQNNLAAVGFADKPEMLWVILAVVGAGIDMASAVKAVRALAPAAKALNAGGDLSDFTKAVRALEKANEIDARVARATEKAGQARTALANARAELATVTSKAYSFPGPLIDPEVYKAVVKMAYNALKTGVYDLQKFIDELRLARINAGLKDLAPEELARAKKAWAEAELLKAVDDARYAGLLKQIPDAAKLDALIANAGDMVKLERLLQVFSPTELEAIFTQLRSSAHLLTMLENVGAGTQAGMIRTWMAESKFGPMNQFVDRLASGAGKELVETAVVGAKSIVIDSNTAIALVKDADPVLRATMHAGEKARVAFIKSLPAGTELRATNLTIGEVGSGAVNMKGVPLEVARESADYQKVLDVLVKENVGRTGGFADRGLITDVFFAKSESGVIPRFLTADQPVVKKLAGLATPKIDVNSIGGYPGLLKKFGPGGGAPGFNVTIGSRTITVIPVP